MILQKLLHSTDDFLGSNGDQVVTHVVNTIMTGGEYTVCGRAIIDADIDMDGWCAVGKKFRGSIEKCNCKDCVKIIKCFKSLR